MTIAIINATKVYPSFRTILSRELLNMVIDRKDKELVEVLINSGRFTEETLETIKNTVAYKELYDTNK